MSKEKECPICGALATEKSKEIIELFYSCPVCGMFKYTEGVADLTEFDYNHLGSYLVYNGFLDIGREGRFFTTLSKEKCDEYNQANQDSVLPHGHPVHLSKENVENWYPKTLSEKTDYILLYFNNHIRHMGEEIYLKKEDRFGVFFVERYEIDSCGNKKERSEEERNKQADYYINYLVDSKLIIAPSKWNGQIYERRPFTLSPNGYARVDTLLRNTANGKNVLVAMEFGDKTQPLREAIRSGVEKAGYVAIFIDEVQQNDFITPELLKYIKDSKFVVVDLTHKNRGAYFEEGYAMGVGKSVIQLCQKDVSLHFDIAQKNTIMWKTEDDIPERLKNRIIATID